MYVWQYFYRKITKNFYEIFSLKFMKIKKKIKKKSDSKTEILRNLETQAKRLFFFYKKKKIVI